MEMVILALGFLTTLENCPIVWLHLLLFGWILFCLCVLLSNPF